MFEFIGKLTAEGGNVFQQNFFITRDGLFVDRSFDNYLDEHPVNSNVTPFAVELSKRKLTREVSDFSLCRKLPEHHVFETGEFLQVFTTLLEKQWGGKDGDLITNGCSNIFYVWDIEKTEVFTVDALFNSVNQTWYMRTSRFGTSVSINWGDGDVVFSFE